MFWKKADANKEIQDALSLFEDLDDGKIKIPKIKWEYPSDEELDNELRSEYEIEKLVTEENSGYSGLEETYKNGLKNLKECSNVETIPYKSYYTRENFKSFVHLLQVTKSYGGRKYPETMVQTILENKPLPMPIAVKRNNGKYEIIGGRTRAGLADLAKQDLTALVIDEKEVSKRVADYIKLNTIKKTIKGDKEIIEHFLDLIDYYCGKIDTVEPIHPDDNKDWFLAYNINFQAQKIAKKLGYPPKPDAYDEIKLLSKKASTQYVNLPFFIDKTRFGNFMGRLDTNTLSFKIIPHEGDVEKIEALKSIKKKKPNASFYVLYKDTYYLLNDLNISTSLTPIEKVATLYKQADFKSAESIFTKQDIPTETIKEYFDLYKKYKDRITDLNEKNIDWWAKNKTFQDFKNYIDNLKTTKSKSETKKLHKIKGAELIAENEDWYVYKITTHEAAKLYGSGTKWCITEDNPKAFNDYYKSNDFYFFISKNLPEDHTYYKTALMLGDCGGKTYYDAKDNPQEGSFIYNKLNMPKINVKNPMTTDLFLATYDFKNPEAKGYIYAARENNQANNATFQSWDNAQHLIDIYRYEDDPIPSEEVHDEIDEVLTKLKEIEKQRGT